MNTLFDELMLVEDGKPVPMPIQLDFLERGRAAYTSAVRRVLWQAPCGAGKTVIASEQTKRALAKDKTVLHIAPRRKLVDQMLAMLKRFGIDAAPIMEGRSRWNSRVYCASRDTLLAMLKDGSPPPRQDLLVWDEAHVAAAELQRWYLANTPGAFWAGYTATPVQPDGSSLAPPWQGLVSMAPTSKMIELGRLVPVKVYNPDAVGRRRRKGEKVKPVGDPVEHWKKYADGLPTVAFAATVADSLALVERFNTAGIPAEHIDANTPEDQREAVFERSRKGITLVISNVGVLIMGVDLQWLVCCMILRGCNSLVLWMQSVGRIMRAFEEKDFGIVLDFAAAAHEFGLPDADFRWTLENAKSNAKKNKPPKERKLIACQGCGYMFVGPACPECGRVLPKSRRQSLLAQLRPGDGVLTRFNGEQREAIQQDALERLFRQHFFACRARGLRMNAVAARFSKDAKMPPWEAGLPFNLPHGKDGWQTPAAEWRLT